MFTEDEKRFLDALEAALVAARKSPAGISPAWQTRRFPCVLDTAI